MGRYETKRSRELRLKRQRRSNVIAMLSAIAVVFLLSIVIWNGKQSLSEKNGGYASQKAELSQKIAEEESRSISLEEYRKYVQTKKYAEQIAKEKFGLVYPDEILFKPSDNSK